MQWFNQRTVWSTIRNFFSTQLVFQWTLKFRHASSLKKKKRRKLHQVIEDWYPPASSARSKSVKSQSNHLPRALTNPLPPITLHQRPPSPSLLQLNRRIFLVKRERVSRVSSNHPLSAYLLSRSSSIFRTVNRFWRSAGGGDIKGERKQGESRGNAEWEKEEEKKRRVGRLRWSPRKRTDNETTFPRFLPFRFHPPLFVPSKGESSFLTDQRETSFSHPFSHASLLVWLGSHWLGWRACTSSMLLRSRYRQQACVCVRCCRCDHPVVTDGVFPAGGPRGDANLRGGATYRYRSTTFLPATPSAHAMISRSRGERFSISNVQCWTTGSSRWSWMLD